MNTKRGRPVPVPVRARRERRAGGARIGCLLAVIVSLAQACALPPPVQPGPADVAAVLPSVDDSHVVHSARLHELMAGLRRLPSQRLPQELDRGRREAEVFASLVDTAKRLQVTAGELPASIPGDALDPGERQRFDELALELDRGASELGLAAELGDRGRVSRALGRLEGTCDACHLRYRPDARPVRLPR